MANEKHIIVYIARHGTTDLNQKDAFRGPIDAPLDKKGTQDANQLAYYFEPLEVSYIFHSDKKRTRATGEMIASRKGMEAFPQPGLRAWNVGDLGGKPKNEENEAIIHWHVQHPDVPLPGGESLYEFQSRVRPLITDAITEAFEAGSPILLVAHSSVIHEVGTMLGDGHDYTLVEPGGVAAIYVAAGKLDAEPIFKPRPRQKQPELT